MSLVRMRRRRPTTVAKRRGRFRPVARAARSVADTRLHATEMEHRAFSAEESLAELRELATSAGAVIAGEMQQRRQKPDSATLIGSGKVLELKGAVASVDPDLVIFDYELTPSQQRNLERELKVRVIDRTQLILDIFARHARTREGQMQVELAQLEYLLPRLAGRGVEMSQLGGGIGTRGPGETQLETDRRKIYRRIRHVKEQLENVRRIRGQQRQRRESVPVAVVALVGYTNAGKSTLFNALTKPACWRVRECLRRSTRRCGKSSCRRSAKFWCLTQWDLSGTCHIRWCRRFVPRWKRCSGPHCCCMLPTPPVRRRTSNRRRWKRSCANSRCRTSRGST